MIILFVIDNYESQSNGATITTRRFREALMKRGHEVRVLTISSKKEKDIYALKERELPLVTGIVHKQDTMFAKADKEIIKNALTGVDKVSRIRSRRRRCFISRAFFTRSLSSAIETNSSAL